MKRHILTLAATILCCIAALSFPSRPMPARLVNDLAGLFDVSQAAELERILVSFDDSTSNQIAVLTVNDLEGYEASEYATRIGLDWGVGSEKFDNGVVILVKPKTSSPGQVFIAVGYGLEGAIPDAYAKRIINNEMIPCFMENDYYGGVYKACEILMKLASGEISQMQEYEEDDEIYAIIAFLIIIFMIIIILSFANKNGGAGGNGGSRGRNVYTGPIITTGNDFGGWGRSSGFGGGGFGGFGGFGGGSFGGGGAGGSW